MLDWPFLEIKSIIKELNQLENWKMQSYVLKSLVGRYILALAKRL